MSRATSRYHERVRTAIGRYADGVHESGPPLSDAAIAAGEAALGVRLAPELRELYRSFDGLRLFTDSVVVLPLAGLRVEGGLIVLGEALGARVLLDEAGRVHEEQEGGELVTVGGSLDRWLDAVLAREALIVDREGEFRDVFAGAEGELKPEVARRRAQAGLKADPSAAAWQIEAAELALEEGDARNARVALAPPDTPGAAPAWALLAGLLRGAGEGEEAEVAYARAAGLSRTAQRQALLFAEAARAAAHGGREGARAAHAARAREADAPVDAWIATARELAQGGELDDALNLAELAWATRPDEAADRLTRELRARRALRPLR